MADLLLDMTRGLPLDQRIYFLPPATDGVGDGVTVPPVDEFLPAVRDTKFPLSVTQPPSHAYAAVLAASIKNESGSPLATGDLLALDANGGASSSSSTDTVTGLQTMGKKSRDARDWKWENGKFVPNTPLPPTVHPPFKPSRASSRWTTRGTINIDSRTVHDAPRPQRAKKVIRKDTVAPPSTSLKIQDASPVPPGPDRTLAGSAIITYISKVEKAEPARPTAMAEKLKGF